MGLPSHYRFRLENKTGVTIGVSEVTITLKRQKIGPLDAEITPESVAVSLQNSAAILDGGFGTIGVEQDNTLSGTHWAEGEGTVKIAISTVTPNGDVVLRLQVSGTGGASDWPDDGLTQSMLAIATITAVAPGGTKTPDFRFR